MPPSSSHTLYTSTGQPLTLGKKLGEGGEGYVCAVRERSNQVAKIYHINHLPDSDKQAKLRYMIAHADADLLDYVAWATDTLHKRKGGRIIGFLMPKVVDCYPIHTLYNPSHRRQSYPELGFKFLLYTARNVASAIDTLHKKGHVIGDINQGNQLFNKNSKVTLIDADSFQISTPTTTHLSLVGVAHFTPPELQGNTNFDSIARTQHHDNFGLAVLIFHLLFGGRHPFAGVPLINEAGNLLEHDIKAYRYAYAPDHDRRGLKPPPASIPIDIVPRDIQQLFVQAFSRNPLKYPFKESLLNAYSTKEVIRPTAEQWITALDNLLPKVITCQKDKQHQYLNHLSACPWCALEQRGLVYFGKTKIEKIVRKGQETAKQQIKALKQACENLPTYSKYYASTLLPKTSRFNATARPFGKPTKSLTPNMKGDFLNPYLQMKFNTHTIMGKLLSYLHWFSCLVVVLLWIIISLGAILAGAIGAFIAMGYAFAYWLKVPTEYTYWIGGWYFALGIVVCFSPLWYLIGRTLISDIQKKIESKKRQTTLNQARNAYIEVQTELQQLSKLIKYYNTEKEQLYKAYDKYLDIKRNPYKFKIKRHRGQVVAEHRSKVHALHSDILSTMDSHYRQSTLLLRQIEQEKMIHQNKRTDYRQIAKDLAQAEADYNVLNTETANQKP